MPKKEVIQVNLAAANPKPADTQSPGRSAETFASRLSTPFNGSR